MFMNTQTSRTSFSAKDLCQIGIFTALIVVCSQLSIPMPAGVPMTLQTLIIPIAGIVLGAKRGTIAACLYVLLGAVGLPVFAGFTGGLGILFGMTGGFILSFPLMALFAGLGSRRNKKMPTMAGLVTGAVVNYHLTVSNIAKKNQIRKLNESLSQIANHDSLTRLKNRHALNADIPDYLGGEICVCMMDINKFKSINDTFGHQKGDEVLCHDSEVLLGNFTDKYIYRYGGDEFLVIYPGATTDTIHNIMRNVNERLARYRIDLSDIRLGCAYGCVSGSVTSQGELIALIASADAALYQQKKHNLYQQSSYS